MPERLRTAKQVEILAVLAVMGVVPGCMENETQGEVRFSGAWQSWQDDPLPHLVLYLYNEGPNVVRVGPGGTEIRILGPQGAVPIVWGGTDFARSLYADQAVAVGLHPRSDPTGLFVLSIDHAWGEPASPPRGDYQVCLEGACSRAPLE